MTETLPTPDPPPQPSAGLRPRALRRRTLLGACLAPLLANGAHATAPDTFPDGATLLVAGPDGGRLDALSLVVAPAIERALPPGTVLRRTKAGGADGVTAANQFAVRTEPDGDTMLMVPGAAALAWLAGDTRVHFDAAHWVPVMAGLYSGVVAGRLPAGGLASGRPIRVAAAGPIGPDLPALLALDLLGAPVVPVFGIADAAAARQALVQGRVDLVFLHGSQVPNQVAALGAAGGHPLFSLGTPDQSGAFARDPLFPDLPDMAEYCTRLRGAPPSGPLYTAWRGTAAAAQLCFGLVLPQLTPPALVAIWRRAGAAAAGAPEVQAAAASAAFSPVATPGATGSTVSIAADMASLLELRRWLATRLDWQPG
ncbi:MAG: hypothetical protein JO264_16460 [Acidisphaera sp.]|nr:hypothetical protein [Acidisphaera sp.]